MHGRKELHAPLRGVMLQPMRDQEQKLDPQPSVQQIVDHLDLVIASPSFSSSKRCQDFLRYVVSETVEGRREEINERTIAHMVFGKSQRFEPSEDSLVRVKAHEVRRRLAQFYRENPGSPLKIDIPHGGYAPNFISAPLVVDEKSPTVSTIPTPATPHKFNRRKVLWYVGGAAVVAASVPVVIYTSRKQPRSELDQLWEPVLDAKTPLLISVPVLQSKTIHGTLSDRVGIGVTAAISQAADFLNARRIPYHLRFGSGLTFAELREQPSLLLGGFTSSWGLWATKGLRFSLVAGEQWAQSYVEDAKTKQRWQAVNLTPDGRASVDYAIVARLFDADSNQILFVAAGITTYGTEGAASVLFDPKAFSHLLQGAPHDWPSRNFEAVVKVPIIETTPSEAEIVAKQFW